MKAKLTFNVLASSVFKDVNYLFAYSAWTRNYMKLNCKQRCAETKEGSTGAFLLSALICGSALLLTSCSPATGASSSAPETSSGEVRRIKMEGDINVNDARSVAKTASRSEGFSTDTPKTSIGSAKGNMSPPENLMREGAVSSFASKGLNVENLFEEKIRNDDKRFDRLERSVQNMNDYLAGIAPSIERLVEIESDIQNLVEQLETLVNQDPAVFTTPAPAPAPAPAPTAAQTKTVAKSPAPQPTKTYAKARTPNNFGPLTIANARGSSSAGKTRLVFELSEVMDFSYDLDNQENILSLFFPTAKTASLSLAKIEKLKLVKNATITPQGNQGYVVAISLARSASVVGTGKIKPNKDSAMYRVFLDLK